MPKAKTVDIKTIENLLAQNSSDILVCQLLGVNIHYISQRSKNDPEFKAAVERGRAARNSENGNKTAEKEMPVGNENGNPPAVEPRKAIEYREEDFYNFGREKLSHTEIAKLLGTNVIGVSQILNKNENLQVALERGKNGLPLKDEIVSDLDEELLEKVFETVAVRKIFFLTDIAGQVSAPVQTTYKILGELVRRKRLERDDSGNSVRYLAVTDSTELSPAVPKKNTGQSVSDRLLEAMDKGFRTITKMKTAAGIEKSVDVSEQIDTMIVNRVIRRCDNGTFSAYFRYETLPRKFWLTDDGRVGVDFDEKFVPSKPVSIEASKEFNISYPGEKRKGREARPIDAVELEKLAESCRTQEMIAVGLGMSVNNLCLRLSKDPNLKAVYDTGREKYAEKNKVDVITVEAAKVEECLESDLDCAEKISTKFSTVQPLPGKDPVVQISAPEKNLVEELSAANGVIPEPVENIAEEIPDREALNDLTNVLTKKIMPPLFEELALQGLTLREVAEELEMPYEELTAQMDEMPECKQAYRRGAEKRFNEVGFGDRKVSEFVSAGRKEDVHVSEAEEQAGDPFVSETLDETFIGVDARSTNGDKLVSGEMELIVFENKDSNGQVVPVPPERFGQTHETLAEKGRPSRASIERVKNKLTAMDPLPKIEVMPFDAPTSEELHEMPEPQMTSVELLGGGSLDLALNVNLFEADDEDLKFIIDVRHLVREFKQRSAA